MNIESLHRGLHIKLLFYHVASLVPRACHIEDGHRNLATLDSELHLLQKMVRRGPVDLTMHYRNGNLCSNHGYPLDISRFWRILIVIVAGLTY